MTITTSRAPISRDEATEFVYAEAALADSRRYDEWESLWTDDALYWVPAGPDSLAAPDEHISIIYDHRSRIGLRVAQLKTGKRHSQDPASNVCHVVSNVQLVESIGGDRTAGTGSSVETEASFIAVESRVRGLTTWAGRVRHRLVRVDDELRMSRKVVLLVNRDQPVPTMSFLI